MRGPGLLNALNYFYIYVGKNHHKRGIRPSKNKIKRREVKTWWKPRGPILGPQKTPKEVKLLADYSLSSKTIG